MQHWTCQTIYYKITIYVQSLELWQSENCYPHKVINISTLLWWSYSKWLMNFFQFQFQFQSNQSHTWLRIRQNITKSNTQRTVIKNINTIECNAKYQCNSLSLVVPYHKGWHKKIGTFEKPNKNWRNPRKKIYWQKLNHYNLPFKRQ